MNAVELTQIGLRLGLTGEELKRWVQKELIAVEEELIAIEEERIAVELFTKEVKEKEEVVAQLRLKLHEVLLRKKFAQVNTRSEAAALCFESRDAQGDKNDVKGSIAITELACLEQNVPLLTEVTGSDPMLPDTFLWDSSENGKSTMGSVTTLSTPGIDDNHSVTSTKVDASAESDADKDLQTSSLVNAEKKVLSRNDSLKSDNVVANSAGPWPEHSLFEEDKMIGTNIVGNDNSVSNTRRGLMAKGNPASVAVTRSIVDLHSLVRKAHGTSPVDYSHYFNDMTQLHRSNVTTVFCNRVPDAKTAAVPYIELRQSLKEITRHPFQSRMRVYGLQVPFDNG